MPRASLGQRPTYELRIDLLKPTPYAIQRRNRFWEVRDAAGELVCITVYKRGAQEVVRRLCAATSPG